MFHFGHQNLKHKRIYISIRCVSDDFLGLGGQLRYILYVKAGLFTFTNPYLFYLKTTHYKYATTP